MTQQAPERSEHFAGTNREATDAAKQTEQNGTMLIRRKRQINRSNRRSRSVVGTNRIRLSEDYGAAHYRSCKSISSPFMRHKETNLRILSRYQLFFFNVQSGKAHQYACWPIIDGKDQL